MYNCPAFRAFFQIKYTTKGVPFKKKGEKKHELTYEIPFTVRCCLEKWQVSTNKDWSCPSLFLFGDIENH